VHSLVEDLAGFRSIQVREQLEDRAFAAARLPDKATIWPGFTSKLTSSTASASPGL
jgi:hypothetical protein